MPIIPQPEALESVAASQLIPHGTATTSQHTLTQQIHQRTKTTTTNRLRQDLLNLGESDKDEVLMVISRIVLNIWGLEFCFNLKNV